MKDLKSSFPAPRAGVPSLVLAPMEGVTDAPMRALLTERGGFSFCVSEFLRITDHTPPARVWHKHVPEIVQNCLTEPAQTPVQVQLLGGNALALAQAARLGTTQIGVTAIDLNFGCPAPTVNRHDGGATLLKCPERIFEIVQAVRMAVPMEIPVSAKLRLGWDDPSAIFKNAELAAKAGASWITVHGRTKVQGYQPPAYWGPIGELKKLFGKDLPVIANGEIWTLEDFRRCQDETQCEHYMIGRGALANPSLPLQIAKELGIHLGAQAAGLSAQPYGSHPKDWLPLLQKLALLSEPYSRGPTYTIKRLKQWVAMARYKFEIDWFDDFKKLQSISEVFDFLSAASRLRS